MKALKNFENYLLEKRFSKRSIQAIRNNVRAYLKALESEAMPTAYNSVLDYVKHCHSIKNTTHTIRLKLSALSHYFEFLNTGENPAKLIRLKGEVSTVPTRLLSDNQLDELYKKYPQNGLVQKRAKAMLSLLVYQAIGIHEIAEIETGDLRLNEGIIYIPEGKTTNSRSLELKSYQLLLLQDYLVKTRPVMLKETAKITDKLFFTLGKGEGKKRVENVLAILRINLKNGTPYFKNFQQLRQSRITLWIAELGLRKAQYMAGHRYASSTERYKPNQTENLRKELNAHDPLKGLF